MTVEPGFGGQSFMRDVAAEKLLAAREYLSHKPVGGEVHVDGGVNRETAEFVGGLGVDILVVGSVLWIKGRDMGREIRLVRALADEGYQYRLNDGKPPIPRDAMVTFAQLPEAPRVAVHGGDRARRHPGRSRSAATAGSTRTALRDFDLLVPASAEALTEERHAADRDAVSRGGRALAGRLRRGARREAAGAAPARDAAPARSIPPEVDPRRPARA